MNFTDEIKKINLISISASEFNEHNISDNVRKSIALYNKSIVNLKMNCADLAITDLKKSLSLNPDFCEAIKFLGLCYAYKKDFDKAEKIFKKLAKYNMYSMLANDYLKELDVERTALKAIDAIRAFSSNQGNNAKRNIIVKLPKFNNGIKKNGAFPKKFAFLFLVLIIGVGSVGFVHWNRLSIKTMGNKIEDSNLKRSKELEQQEIMNQKYTKTDEQYRKLQKDLENTKLELDTYKNRNNIILKLNDAEKFYQDGNYEKAVDNLMLLKNFALNDTEKSRFDKLWNDIKTNAVWDIYRQGNSLYKQKKYQEALPKLLKVQEIAPELEIAPWVLYQLGNCYKETNDSKNAIVWFEKVRDSYPNSEYASYSESTIVELKSKLNQ